MLHRDIAAQDIPGTAFKLFRPIQTASLAVQGNRIALLSLHVTDTVKFVVKMRTEFSMGGGGVLSVSNDC